ncbi:hypothetical protein AB0K52_24855 [Glycomyces sp. NPDC049804]|uniref:hypothetical protein n=1 Tax=Glycomyces sp. NPDC049804 TaxID=3154363 RepID=UPI00342B8E9B
MHAPTPNVILWTGLADMIPSQARVFRDAFRRNGYTLTGSRAAICDVIAHLTSTGAGAVTTSSEATGQAVTFAAGNAELFASAVADFVASEREQRRKFQ